jgi:alcohol dehydrogenase class IV
MYALAFGAASTGVLHSLAHHMGIRPIAINCYIMELMEVIALL